MSSTDTPQTARMMGEAGSAVDEWLTEDQYDIAGRILDALGKRAAQDFSVSQIAKLGGVRADYDDVRCALRALVHDGHVSDTDRGAWSRFRFVWG